MNTDDRLDLLLRDDARLDQAVAAAPADWTRHLLVAALAGLAVHGLASGLLGASLGTLSPSAYWTVPLTLSAAFLGSLALCLPAFFLTVRLAGYPLPPAEIAALALRAQARASALLIGGLPFAVALCLPGHFQRDWPVDNLCLALLALPFACGAAGLVSVHRALQRRVPELGALNALRVVALWTGFVGAVTPVAFARAAETLLTLRLVE